MNKNNLSGHLVYLCGSIDDSPDGGTIWRKEASLFLINKLNMGVLDPTNKPFLDDSSKENLYTVQYRKQILNEAKTLYLNGNNTDSKKRLIKIHQEMKKVVRYDFRCIDTSHIVLVCLDMNYRICGTYSEICLARIQKKPVIIFMGPNQTVYDLPHWILGQCQPELLFNDFEEVKIFLEKIAFDLDNKQFESWKLFNFNKIYGKEIF